MKLCLKSFFYNFHIFKKEKYSYNKRNNVIKNISINHLII